LVGPLRGRGLDEFVASLRLLRDLAAPCATAGSEGGAVAELAAAE
jgi:hypothetical protein